MRRKKEQGKHFSDSFLFCPQKAKFYLLLIFIFF